MTIYLKNIETNETIGTYTNVDKWATNFVEYTNNGLKTKIYCNDDEYFTDIDESALLSTPDY